jgi:hypothetical protein
MRPPAMRPPAMRPPARVLALLTFAAAWAAAGDLQNPVPGAQTSPRPRQAAPVTPVGGAETSPDKDASAPGAPKFITEDKWLLAGYNNNEVVYQVFVTNQDTRIIRCTTDIKGWYFDDGKKLSITDRQITTALPNQLTQVGNWMDLDQASGATYTVKCHTV